MKNKKTNLQMLVWGMKHIAENHGFKCGDAIDENGSICIYMGCNVPTLSDVRMLCSDCNIPMDNIESCDCGIDVYPPLDGKWEKMEYKQPVHEFWRRMV